MNRRLLIVAMAALLITSAFGPAVVAGTTTQDESTTNENGVTVTTGAQLSTVVEATSTEVRTEFENTAFDERIERSTDNDSDRARAIADRAAVLADRAATLESEYDNVTTAYEAGEIDESTYAQRLASLNARAQSIVSGYERLEERAASVDEETLQAAGVTQDELADQRESVSRFTSAGTDALLRQFTGEARGKAEIKIDGGVSIEVENEDGERSREYERPRDGNGSLVISQTDALESATDALSSVNGSWVLAEAKSDVEDGSYEFEFELEGNISGKAEVSVDGETGTVFALEEKIESRTDDDGEDEDESKEGDDRDGERLAFLVAAGSPAPGETVTLQLLADGQPASDVPVTLNDQSVGTTADDGTISVTLPDGEAKIKAERGEAEAELEFEFEDEHEREQEDESRLNADATVDNGTATVSVTANGTAVSGATVTANDEQVGTTDESGTISFAVPDGEDELEITVEKGDAETELKLDLKGDDGNEDDEREGESEDDDGPDDSEEESDDDSEETTDADSEDE